MAIKTNIQIDVNSKQASKNVKNLTKDTKALDKTSGGLTKTLGGLRAGLGALGIGLSALGLVNATFDAIAFGDSLGKTADKLGLATTTLQEYRFAAEQTGLTTQQLDVGIQRFTRRLGEAADGAGVLAPVMKELNIELKDSQGNLRTTEDVLADYADAIQGAENDQKRLLLAFKAFDTEGVAFVNTLKNGSAGLQDLRDQASELGIIMDEDLIRKAEVATDKWNILTSQIGIKFKSAMLSVLGVLTDLRTPQERFDDLTVSVAETNEKIKVLEENLTQDGMALYGRSANASRKQLTLLKKEASEMTTELERLSKTLAAAKNAQNGLGKETEDNTLLLQNMADAFIQLDKDARAFTDTSMVLHTSLASTLGQDEDSFGSFADTGEDSFKRLESATRGWGDQFTNTLADMVQKGKLDFKSLADAIISDLLRIAIFQTITAPLFSAAGIPGFQAAHSGGVVGGLSQRRNVSPAVFAGAPKFHNGGLVGDEVPIIAKKGEEVLTADDPRHRSNGGGGSQSVSVSIDNKGTSQQVVSSTATQDADGTIINIILEDIKNGGPLRDSIKGLGEY